MLMLMEALMRFACDSDICAKRILLIGISDQSGGGIAILKQIVGKCNFGSCKEWDQDKTDSQIASRNPIENILERIIVH